MMWMTAALLVHSPPDTYFPSVSGTSPNGICPILNLYSVTPGSSLWLWIAFAQTVRKRGPFRRQPGDRAAKGKSCLPPARFGA